MPESEETATTRDVGGLEPADQLQQIQECWPAWSRSSAPAGSIGPEIELVFDDAAHPFQETFQHEEVIKDRYAAPRRRLRRAAADVAPDAGSPAVHRRADLHAGSDELRATGHLPRHANDAEGGDGSRRTNERTQADAGPVPTIAAVRRHEFGRLFAKLRQG